MKNTWDLRVPWVGGMWNAVCNVTICVIKHLCEGKTVFHHIATLLYTPVAAGPHENGTVVHLRLPQSKPSADEAVSVVARTCHVTC